MSEQNSSVRWTRLWRAIDSALYRLMNQRVALTLLLVAAGEALAAPFLGTRWAVYSIATAGVAIGLIAAGAGLWASAIGNAAEKISQTYQRETTRGAETPQAKAASLSGRIN